MSEKKEEQIHKTNLQRKTRLRKIDKKKEK